MLSILESLSLVFFENVVKWEEQNFLIAFQKKSKRRCKSIYKKLRLHVARRSHFSKTIRKQAREFCGTRDFIRRIILPFFSDAF